MAHITKLDRPISVPVRAALACCLSICGLMLVLATPAAAAPDVTEFSSGITAGSAPNFIAKGPDGAMWFTERDGDRLGRIASNGAVTEFPSSGSGLAAGALPAGIVTGPNGHLYFSENGNSAIGELDPTTGQLVGEYQTPNSSGPDGITVGPDGAIWFAEQGTDGTVGRLDPTTHAISEYSVHLASQTVYHPTDLVSGPDGELWITLPGSGQIARMDTSMASPGTDQGVTLYDLPTSGAGTEPEGITTGPNGDLYVAEYGAGNIATIDPSAVSPGTDDGITEYPTGGKPLQLSAAGDGGIWATDNTDKTLLRFDPATHATQTFGAAQGVTGDATAAAEDAAGNLWFTEFNSNVVGKVATAPATTPPATAAPTNTAVPAISGQPIVGQTLACSTGSWTGDPTSFAFQWRVDGQATPGQTSQAHTVLASEAGHQLTCTVTATNAGGSAAATSPPVTVTVAVSPPVVTLSTATASPRAGAPIVLDAAASSPGTGSIVAWRYSFSGLSGRTTAVSCSGSDSFVSVVFSAPVSSTALVSATNSAGLSATRSLPLSVGARAAGRAVSARVTDRPALVSAMCSSSRPTVSAHKPLGFGACVHPREVQAGLVDATGCFAQVTNPALVPLTEALYLAKHDRDYLQALTALFNGRTSASAPPGRAASLNSPDVDTFYVAKGSIMINGLRATPLPGGSLVIAVGGTATSFATQNAAYVVSVPGVITLTAPGGVPLPLSAGPIDFDVSNNGQSSATVAQFDVGDALKALPAVPWLKLSGTLKVDWARCDEAALQKQFTATATGEDAAEVTSSALDDCKTYGPSNNVNPGLTLINGNLALPGMFGLNDGDISAGVGFFADNSRGLVLNGVFAVYQPQDGDGIRLGPVNITGVRLVYLPQVDTLTAHVTGQLLAGISGNLTGDLDFVRGVPFMHLGYHDSSGIPIVPDLVSITKTDLSYPYKDPAGHYHDLGGDMDLALGGYADSTGCPLAGVHGTLSVDLPINGHPFSIDGTSQQQFLCADFGESNAFHLDDHSVSLSGGFGYDLGSLFSASVHVQGTAGIYPDGAHFQLDGTGTAGIDYGPLHVRDSAEVVVSDHGAGVCVDSQELNRHVGFGFKYDPGTLVAGVLIPPPIGPTIFAAYLLSDPVDRIQLQGDSCNIDQYRTIHIGYLQGGPNQPAGTSAARRPHPTAAAANGFTIPAHDPDAIIRLTGATGAPAVTLRGPGGRVIDATGATVATPSELVLRDPGTHTTTIDIAGTNAGLWTVTIAPGSSQISNAALSRQLGTASVSGTVTGRGAHRTLRYVARNLPSGVRLKFFELGSSGASAPLGSATRKLHGTIRFIPDVMAARRRTIIAEIEHPDGTFSPHQTVARYTTSPPRPGRVLGLEAIHRGRSLRIAFKATTLATGYVVAVRLSDGRRLMFLLPASRHRITLRSVARTVKVLKLTVRGTRNGLYGPLTKLGPPRTRHHRR